MGRKFDRKIIMGMLFGMATTFSVASAGKSGDKTLMEFNSIDRSGKVIYSKDKKVTLNAKPDGKVVVIPQKYETPKEMMRTTWVASVENMHFPKKVNGKVRNSVDELKKDWTEILDKHEELNFNTVIFQVSPTLDAVYQSNNRPWAKILTGQQGAAPEWSKDFDLVGWMIEETHKRGMEFHAWFNPYRVTHVAGKNVTLEGEMAKLSKDNFAVKNPETVYMFDGKLYLDPGYDKVRKHITDTVGEFLEKYDVDAIHFDDYFYPYKIARDGVTYYFGDKLEDRETFKKNRRGFKFVEDISTPEKLKTYNSEVEKWRRDNNDLMVHAVKNTIDSYNKKNHRSVQWGISPFGIWEHQFDNPAGTDTPKGSTAANRDIYADTKKWVDDETIDYIIPQVYWEFMQPAAPYGEITSWWDKIAAGKRTQLYIGHADYKHMNAGWAKAWENPEEIGNQMKFNNRHKNIKGSAFFGYSNMLKTPNPENKPGITAQNRHIDYLKNNFFMKKVLVPGKPWLDKNKTAELKNVKMSSTKDGKELAFKDTLKNDSRFYVIYSGKEIVKVVGRDKKSENQKIFIKNSELKGKKITGISIKDRAGIETKVTAVK